MKWDKGETKESEIPASEFGPRSRKISITIKRIGLLRDSRGEET
jgi:hypothetical protein